MITGRRDIENISMQVLPDFELVCTRAGFELESVDVLYTFPLIAAATASRLGSGSGDPRTPALGIGAFVEMYGGECRQVRFESNHEGFDFLILTPSSDLYMIPFW